MKSNNPKVSQKGAVKKLREFYEKNRGHAIPELNRDFKNSFDRKIKR